MSIDSNRNAHLFVVRMWHEPEGHTVGPWRGSIHDVAGEQRLHFTDLQDLLDFIRLRLRDDRTQPLA